MFVYRNKETGKYLIYNERTTHTGTHRSVNWCEDINLAYVGLLSHHMIHRVLDLKDEELERIQVTVQRTVTIV